MKAILLAFIGTVVYLGIATLMFRWAPTQRRAAALLRLFLGTLPIFLAAHLLTPPSLGLIPVPLTERSVWIDRALSLYLYTAAFFGGSLQLYNLAERGFSLRILIDILESATGRMTEESVFRGYGGGRGIEWMYEKRLQGLRDERLVEPDAHRLMLTKMGQRVAVLFGRLRDVLGLELWV